MPSNSHPKDQVQCLKFIQENMNELINDYIILGGDLNIHLDHKLDRGNLKELNTSTRLIKKRYFFL